MSKKLNTEQREETLTHAHHDFEKGLNSYALFKVSNLEDSRDLVQNTFMKTWSYLVKGGKIDTMKAFLYHILNNLIVDEYRKRKHQSSSLDTMLESGFESGTDDSASLFDQLDGKALLLLIQKLTEPYKKVMKMKYIQELTLKEMSLISGQTKNALAVQLHRGLAKLKILYESS
jgi:RNA polymerase sigma-70 factor (ECF subfamily)